MMQAWSALLLATLLAACASSGGGGIQGDAGVDRPASEKPTTSDAQSKARVHVELGNAYLETGRYGTALDESKVAQAYDSSYAPGYLLMGLVYSFLDQHELALPAFQQADRLAPNDPEIGNAYGWYLCNRGRESEGIQRLDRASRNPYYRYPARALTNAGLCELRRNNDKGAEQYLLRAAQIDGSNIQTLYHLASIYYRMGNYARAREWLSALQSRLPGSTAETTWLSLRIERKSGNKEAEARLAAQLQRDFPASDEYIAMTQGKFD